MDKKSNKKANKKNIKSLHSQEQSKDDTFIITKMKETDTAKEPMIEKTNKAEDVVIFEEIMEFEEINASNLHITLNKKTILEDNYDLEEIVSFKKITTLDETVSLDELCSVEETATSLEETTIFLEETATSLEETATSLEEDLFQESEPSQFDNMIKLIVEILNKAKSFENIVPRKYVLYFIALEDNNTFLYLSYKKSKEEILYQCEYLYDYAKLFKPIDIVFTMDDCELTDADKYVKIFMRMFGNDTVRGGSYTDIILPEYQKKSIDLEFETASIENLDEIERQFTPMKI